MDAHTIYTIAAHAHSTTGANNAERRRLARRAQLGELVRIAPGYYLDAEAITAHSEPPVIVALARLLALQHKHPHLIVSGPTAAWLRGPPPCPPAAIRRILPGVARTKGRREQPHMVYLMWHNAQAVPGADKDSRPDSCLGA